MKRILILAASVALASCQPKPFIDVQAHRGGAGLMPENTIPAMKNALDLGVNTLEFDLHLSSDGQVVVSHDSYFHPRYATRPDGTPVREEDPKEYLYTMPYDSIAKYDVGLRPVDRWPGQAKMAVCKPLASELIDFAEDYAGKPVNYNIEIKSWPGEGEGTLWPEYRVFCDTCIPLLLSKNLGGRLIVQSFDPRALNYMHAKWPELTLSYLTEAVEGGDIGSLLGNLDFVPRWWSPESGVVTPENVAWCHEHGIGVVPWTVDDPAEMRRLVQCGVEAIISNYPDILIETVR
ncbi:MAG: glycerophosphodiester phosphodiesterase [Bacteroidales bacterium]|jgi:glycerophosphoryl diester phosphodiesterase|nr:glycerophosphodiester phosphodiesterase [Bacteroidales bacterium]